MLDEMYKNKKEVQMVVFDLGNEKFAVPITSVQEIILPPDMTSIPRAPKFIEGVINLRGVIVPVIDACKRLNIENKHIDEKDIRIIILDIDNQTIGLVVNDVSEVINICKDSIDKTVANISNDTDFFWGVAKIKDKLLILVNPEELLNLTEKESLKGIGLSADSIKQSLEKATEKEKTVNA